MLFGAIAGSLSEAAIGQEPFRIDRDPPRGFEDLLSPREATVELFLDGSPLGHARIIVAPGTVQFLEPDRVIGLLPPVRDIAALRSQLLQPQQANSDRSCHPKPIAGCGLLSPALLGLIYSRDTDRIDLFLGNGARSFVRRTLPGPQVLGPTVAGAVDLQYGLSRRGLDFTLRQRTVAGFGRVHAVLESAVGDRYSSLDQAFLRSVNNRNSWSAGLFQASPFDFIHIDRILGARLATSDETRLDGATAGDTPILVDVSTGGTVEIYREGILLDTQRVSPGAFRLDSSRLPGGVYPIELKIFDGAGERTETRLFVRARDFPPIGETRYFIEAGTNLPFRSTLDGFFPRPLSAVVRAGAERRLSGASSISGLVELSEVRRLAELEFKAINRKVRIAANAAIADNGDSAASINLSSGARTFNWSVDARVVEGSSRFPADPERGLGRTYRQLVALAGWNRGALSMNAGLILRKDPPQRTSWSLFPRMLWTISRGDGRLLQLDAYGTVSQSEWTIRVGLRRSIFRPSRNLVTFAGAEAHRRHGDLTLEPIGRVDWAKAIQSGTNDLKLTAAVSRDGRQTWGRAGGELISTYFRASADAQINERLSSSNLFGRFETSFGIADGRVAFGSAPFSGAGIIAEVPAAPGTASFAVRSGSSRGRPFRGSGPIFTSAVPFSQSTIGVDVLAGSAALNTVGEHAVFYPGTVWRLRRQSSRTTVIFGQLVDEHGELLADAKITNAVGSAQSDEKGYIQIETSGQKFVVQKRDKEECVVELPDLDLEAPLNLIERMVCTQR